MRLPRALAAAVLLAATAACSPPAPSSPPASSGPPGAMRIASPSLPASATPSPTASPAPSLGLGLTANLVDQAYTTPMLATATDGRWIAWSRGATPDSTHATEVWAMEAGGPDAPRRVYADPHRDAQLSIVAVSGGGLAWVESRDSAPGQWWIWYLAAGGAQPVEVDHVTVAGFSQPIVALDGGHLVWTRTARRGGADVSEITSLELATGARATLRSEPASRTEFVWVALAGGKLAYATIGDGDAGSPRHVWLRDLAAPGGIDRQLDASGRAALPATNGQVVVWKEAANEYDEGSLVAYSIADGRTSDLAFGDESGENYPVVGARFVAAWLGDYTNLWVYDLAGRKAVLLESFPSAGPLMDVRPVVAGDLLVWIRGMYDDSRPLQLVWARLPD